MADGPRINFGEGLDSGADRAPEPEKRQEPDMLLSSTDVGARQRELDDREVREAPIDDSTAKPDTDKTAADFGWDDGLGDEPDSFEIFNRTKSELDEPPAEKPPEAEQPQATERPEPQPADETKEPDSDSGSGMTPPPDRPTVPGEVPDPDDGPGDEPKAEEPETASEDESCDEVSDKADEEPDEPDQEPPAVEAKDEDKERNTPEDEPAGELPEKADEREVKDEQAEDDQSVDEQHQEDPEEADEPEARAKDEQPHEDPEEVDESDIPDEAPEKDESDVLDTAAIDYGREPLTDEERQSAQDVVRAAAAVDPTEIRTKEDLDSVFGDLAGSVTKLVEDQALADPDTRYVKYGYGPEATHEAHGRVGNVEASIICAPSAVEYSMYPPTDHPEVPQEGMRATLPGPGRVQAWIMGDAGARGKRVGDSHLEVLDYATVVHEMAHNFATQTRPNDAPEFPTELASTDDLDAPPPEGIEHPADAPEALSGVTGFMRPVGKDHPVSRGDMAESTRLFQAGVEQLVLGNLDAIHTRSSANMLNVQFDQLLPSAESNGVSDHLYVKVSQFVQLPPMVWVEHQQDTANNTRPREAHTYKIDSKGIVNRVDQLDFHGVNPTLEEVMAYEQAHTGPVGPHEIRGLFAMLNKAQRP